MKTKDYIFATLAGFILVLFWYGQFALSLTDYSDIFLDLFIYPLIPAICLIFLLKHKRLKYVFAKIGIFLISSFFFLFITAPIDPHYLILNAFIPGYGRMSAGGGFGLMLETFFYLGINGIAVLISLCFCKSVEKETI